MPTRTTARALCTLAVVLLAGCASEHDPYRRTMNDLERAHAARLHRLQAEWDAMDEPKSVTEGPDSLLAMYDREFDQYREDVEALHDAWRAGEPISKDVAERAAGAE